MTGIPELKVEGLHPDHADILQQALDEARELLARAQQGPLGCPDPMERRRRTKAAAGKVASEPQSAGNPWDTDSVTSWVSPNLKKNKKEE
ncbi:hypothetical protein I3U40_08100 [Mycobacteroides abscessus subsp. abscessus]|uniref:hypothetical protein n=1 Tax=Mycobacteroides abscessus TaxID=36809 RepID=UPI0019D00968|nr:hypothetical protein [Mycobacteroides abscessus]QSM95694.1 hypothetical protein I3U31_08090 [Mycobacteroides abscessus subsp. abscessus]QSN00727.1 hypothetical protein I3U40_08100 [Mycobacteroides abscessus subsp. abscessus]